VPNYKDFGVFLIVCSDMDGGRQSVGLTALQHNITSVIVAIILFTGIYPQNALNKEGG